HYWRQSIESSSNDAAGQERSPGEPFYYAQQTKAADEILDELRVAGAQADALEADLADVRSIGSLFDHAEQRFGPVEVLVNNAACWEADTFVPSGAELDNKLVELWTARPKSITPESFDRLFAVNTRAPALLIAEFARRH